MTQFVTDTECERVVADLLAMMSLREKAGQIAQRRLPSSENRDAMQRLCDDVALGHVGIIAGITNREEADRLQTIAQESSRLGIPMLFPGHTGTGLETIMPVPLSAAASWDMDAIEAAETVVSHEAQAHGLNWATAPEVALALGDSRARAQQSGSDITLAARIAAARIRGLQDDSGRPMSGMLACLEMSDMQGDDPIAMLRISRAAMTGSRVGSIGFNGFDGSERGDIDRAFAFLKGPGGFDGILLSEWAAMAHAATGTDMPASDEISVDLVAEAVARGDLARERLDDAVARVLRAKFRLGLLSAAHMSGTLRPASALPTPVHNREVALELAKRSGVLLRNEPHLLPLGIDSGDVLLVGAAASDRRFPLAGRSGLAASVIDGLEQLGVPHRFVPGLALRGNDDRATHMIGADNMAIGMACEAAKRAGTVIFVHAGDDRGAIGEADAKLLSALFAANPSLVLVTLGPVPLDPLVDGKRLPCILHAGQLGTMSGHAVAELLTGEASPSGKLPLALGVGESRGALAFGHGLTYADFALTGLSIDIARDRVCAFIDLRNTGERDGLETVQLYLRRHADGPLQETQKGLELVDFQRVRMRPGERETLVFELGREEFGSYSKDGRFQIEPGTFDLFVGLSSKRGQTSRIQLTEELARAMTGHAFPMIASSTQRSA